MVMSGRSSMVGHGTDFARPASHTLVSYLRHQFAARTMARGAVGRLRREERRVAGFEEIDFFTDESLVEDPYPYFDDLRSQCPVLALPHHGVVAVTGYDEATEVYRDLDDVLVVQLGDRSVRARSRCRSRATT